MASADIWAPSLARHLTVRIRGLRVLSARLWLAAQLFAFAAWVAGCNIEIETEAQ